MEGQAQLRGKGTVEVVFVDQPAGEQFPQGLAATPCGALGDCGEAGSIKPMPQKKCDLARQAIFGAAVVAR